MHSTFVSVIIPTKGRPKMLRRALKSVFDQSYPHLEIIVIVDGNDQETETYLDAIFKEGAIHKLIINTASKGGAEARNQGISAATGKYISFLDDDDIWHWEKIRKQVEAIEKNPDISIVGCQYLMLKPSRKRKSELKLLKITSEDIKYNNYLGSFSFCLTYLQMAKNITIPKDLSSCQDWYLWFHILSSNNGKALILDEILCEYDMTKKPGITNTSQNKIKGHRYFFTLVEDQLNVYQKYFQKYIISKVRLTHSNHKFIKRLNLLVAMYKNLFMSNRYLSIKYHLKELLLLKG